MNISHLKSFLNRVQLEALSQATTVEALIEALSGFRVQNPQAAGIDIGSMEHMVAVPGHLSEQTVRPFGSYTQDLFNLAHWLLEIGVKTVVMESTGPYWQNLYEILETKGLEIFVVNARHAKNVTGRKSDVQDCQWLLQLHTYGLLGPSFIPPAQIRTLRTYHRQRGYLIEEKSRDIQAITRSLTAMNLKFQHLVSDMEGVCAQKILRAIAQGEQDPLVLAQHRSAQMKASVQEFEQALEGHYRAEHLFSLRQALASWDFHQAQIKVCDQEIEQQLALLSWQQQAPESKEQTFKFVSRPLSKKPRKNECQFELKSYLHEQFGVDLTQVKGFNTKTLLCLLAEIGPQLDPWKSVKHFVSWLGLSPNPQISGGKVKGHKVLKTRNRAAQAFRLAAYAIQRSDCYLGLYYRSISHRKGKKVAIKALARKLATIFYKMVKEQLPYRPHNLEAYQDKQKKRKEKRIRKMAQELGYQIIPITDS